MNKVLLVGRISQDVKQITFENGGVKSTFSVATKESYKDKEGNWVETADFHNVVLFKETKLQKGDMIAIEGKLKMRSYEQDGVKKYVTEVVGQHTELLARPKPNEAVPVTVRTNDHKATEVYKGKDTVKEPASKEVQEDLPF